MVEDAIRNADISKSVQRFQLAIESAKVRLDLAISPGLWLLPSKMVVNTESVVGYNNKLKKATIFMKIGINSDLNIPVRRSTQKHNFGRGAIKLPHSGVETQDSDRESGDSGAGESQAAGATAELEAKPEQSSEKAKLRTKETGVVKSDSRAGATAELEAKPEQSSEKAKPRTKTVSTSHETNLNVLIIVAGGLAWFLFR